LRLRFQVFRPRRIQDMLFCLPFLTPRVKLHHLLQKCSFFLIKLAAFLARGGARMKLHFQNWSWFNLCVLGIL
jgi:hypothetical protein